MSWTVIIDGYAKKYLKRIPKKDTDRIRKTLRELSYNPYAGDIEKMEGDKIEAASYQRKIQNCTTKANDSNYFYCNADFIKSNIEIEQIEQKNCEAKYPLNF